MVAIRGLGEFRELAAGAPVKVASVDNDAAHARAVAANPFGAAVGDDIGAQGDGTRDVAAHAESVVNDQRDTGVVGDFCDGRDVRDVVLWIADGLDVDGSGVFVNRVFDVGGIIALNKLDLDLELLHVHSELVVRAAIQPTGADKVVAWLAAICDGHELARIDQNGS